MTDHTDVPPEYKLVTTAGIDRVIWLLNEALLLDSAAVCRLVEARVPANDALAVHPSIQVGYEHLDDATPRVGVLGILNGVFGRDPGGWGPICAAYDDGGRLLRFALATPLARRIPAMAAVAREAVENVYAPADHGAEFLQRMAAPGPENAKTAASDERHIGDVGDQLLPAHEARAFAALESARALLESAKLGDLAVGARRGAWAEVWEAMKLAVEHADDYAARLAANLAEPGAA